MAGPHAVTGRRHLLCWLARAGTALAATVLWPGFLSASVAPPPAAATPPLEGPSSAAGADVCSSADAAAREWTAPTFAVRVGDEVVPHELMSAMVLPSGTMELEVLASGSPSERFTACAEGRALARGADGTWLWQAPDEPGISDVLILDPEARERSTIRFLVLQPWNGAERLGDFRVGTYELEPLRGLDNYRPPRGFIRVTRELVDLKVSPNFRLGQFLSKQPDEFPKYARVSTRALLKLEWLLEEIRSAGIEADSLTVMSGFRTPWYNRAIGNTTEYSRHLYGDAVDVFVDQDGDRRMDDLDGDGRVGFEDAALLAEIVDGAASSPWYRPFVGGLGVYGPAPHRGPFIHIDVRGYRARWSAP